MGLFVRRQLRECSHGELVFFHDMENRRVGRQFIEKLARL